MCDTKQHPQGLMNNITCNLTLKVPITTPADDILKCFLYYNFFRDNKAPYFM